LHLALMQAVRVEEAVAVGRKRRRREKRKKRWRCWYREKIPPSIPLLPRSERHWRTYQ
jgi:hypothetical protein